MLRLTEKQLASFRIQIRLKEEYYSTVGQHSARITLFMRILETSRQYCIDLTTRSHSTEQIEAFQHESVHALQFHFIFRKKCKKMYHDYNKVSLTKQ